MPTDTIIANQPDYLVLNKAAGNSLHSENEPGLVQQWQTELNQALYPVHRLDKATSGVLLLAKNHAQASQYSQYFAKRECQKFYIALATGKPKKKQGWVKGDMIKARGGSYRLTTSHNNPAITQFFSYSLAPGLRLYVLKPITGKTHQLRVAMKSLGVAILGDERYGGDKSDRCYLHAWQLNLPKAELSWQATELQGQLFEQHQVGQWLKQLGPLEAIPWPG